MNRRLSAAEYSASGTILTSSDGITWTAQASGSTNQLNGVVSTGAQLVATGTGTVLTSPDGATWLTRTGMGTTNFNGVVWSPELSRFGIVGDAGTVITSP